MRSRFKASQQMKLAIVGINGLPPAYGGFETLAANLVAQWKSCDIVVYCTSFGNDTSQKSYCGARLLYIPVKANGALSVLFDLIGMAHALLTGRVMLILGPSAGIFVPVLTWLGAKVVVNHGGLNEWEREKFSVLGRFWSRLSHSAAARFSKGNIVDNEELKKSLMTSFGAQSVVVRYGGDHCSSGEIKSELIKKYEFVDKPYYLAVARAQIDNNIEMLVEAFRYLPNYSLVVVSNWHVNAHYQRFFEQEYPENITLLPAIYDQEELNGLRSNATAYIHSHSRCGTAPSLVEAMSLGLPVLSFDRPTNRETTKDRAKYFSDERELQLLVSSTPSTELVAMGRDMASIARESYTWRIVAEQYLSEMLKAKSGQEL